MDNKRDSYLVAIIALVLAVGGLAIGFSAFSNTLKIQSAANVTPSDTTFNVDFSSSDTVVATNDITPTVDPTTVTATNATINNSGVPTISDLSATFSEPGQKAIYSFYAYNAGEYDAFLKSITYENAIGSTSFRKCTAGEGTNDALVQNACQDIAVKVKVGTENETAGSKTSITDHTLLKGRSEEVTVTIEYLASGARADGDFVVSFGDISLYYSSTDE